MATAGRFTAPGGNTVTMRGYTNAAYQQNITVTQESTNDIYTFDGQGESPSGLNIGRGKPMTAGPPFPGEPRMENAVTVVQDEEFTVKIKHNPGDLFVDSRIGQPIGFGYLLQGAACYQGAAFCSEDATDSDNNDAILVVECPGLYTSILNCDADVDGNP